MIRQDIGSLNQWFADNGDYTHNINYELNNDSVVIDLGGYYGLWIDEILKKNNPNIPNIILVEPVPEFYNHLVTKYENYEKIKVMNVGVSTDKNEATKTLYVSSDGSSTNFNINVKSVIQINIEGDEYGLMEYMIESNTIDKFKNIQIQFHLGIDNDIERRNIIQKNLVSKGFKNKFDYPFVWESWEK